MGGNKSNGHLFVTQTGVKLWQARHANNWDSQGTLIKCLDMGCRIQVADEQGVAGRPTVGMLEACRRCNHL